MLCGAAAAEQAARHVQARPQRLPIREPPAALPTCAAALALSPCRLRACWLQCLDNNQTEQCASASYKVAKVALERLQDADVAEAGGAATKTVLALRPLRSPRSPAKAVHELGLRRRVAHFRVSQRIRLILG